MVLSICIIIRWSVSCLSIVRWNPKKVFLFCCRQGLFQYKDSLNSIGIPIKDGLTTIWGPSQYKDAVLPE